MDMSNVPVVGKLILGLGCFNILVTAIKNILDKVSAGSNADTLAGKVSGILSKILSFVSANTTAPAQVAAPAPAAQPTAPAPAAQ